MAFVDKNLNSFYQIGLIKCSVAVSKPSRKGTAACATAQPDPEPIGIRNFIGLSNVDLDF
jgi:hypothetical protein